MRIRMVLLLLMIPALSAIFATPALCNTETPPALAAAREQVAARFDHLDAGLRQTAKELGITGLTGDQARAALTRMCANFDYAVDCAAVNLQGKMVTIEPAPYRQFEGKDISAQEQVKGVLKTGKPLLSNVFRAVEGFPAVDAEYPVVTPTGVQLGSVSILFHPEKLLGKILIPLLKGTPVEIWVMEKGGLLLYDNDVSQIGLNLFTSRLYKPYPSLIRVARRIAAKPEGSDVYRYRTDSSPSIVKKIAFWQSVSLYGTEWRLVAIHVQHDDPAGKTGILASSATLEQKLGSFAAANPLIKALAAGDQTKGMQLFKEFYDDAPGIYSVQWVDEKGINRFGYPRENSLSDYDFNALRKAGDQKALQVLAERKPAAYEAPLFEGRTGIFVYRPVWKQDRYLGMIYTIRLKQ